MLKLAMAIVLTFSPAIAYAGCEFATGPCSQDRYGNTYRTEQNLGGGYNTYRNGQLNSQTSQNLSGGYTTTYQNGSAATYSNRNPYETHNSRQNQGNIPLYLNRLGDRR